MKSVAIFINPLLEQSHESVHPDDSEDQPKDNAHCQNIKDARKGTNKGTHDNLHSLHLSHGSEGSQCSQCSHGLENRNISSTHQTCTKVQQGYTDNYKI